MAYIMTLTVTPEKADEIRRYARERQEPYSHILQRAFDELKARDRKEKMGPCEESTEGPVSDTSSSVPRGETLNE